MATSNVPVKTPQGLEELASRQRKLSQRHRTVLLLVDGKRSENDIRTTAVAAGCPTTCFDDLIETGLIARAALEEVEMQTAARAVDIEVPASAPDSDLGAAADSISSSLPASRTLAPDSNLDPAMHQTTLPAELAESAPVPLDMPDPALEEARAILLRAVRAEAPVAGSLTMMRLRRARSREDIEDLLDEVEARIFKPFKGLWASQTMARVRELLATQPPLSLP